MYPDTGGGVEKFTPDFHLGFSMISFFLYSVFGQVIFERYLNYLSPISCVCFQCGINLVPKSICCFLGCRKEGEWKWRVWGALFPLLITLWVCAIWWAQSTCCTFITREQVIVSITVTEPDSSQWEEAESFSAYWNWDRFYFFIPLYNYLSYRGFRLAQ